MNYLRKKITYICLFITCLLAVSCGKSSSQPSTGNPYELLVVADSNLLNRPAGKVLTDVFYADTYGTIYSDPSFTAKYITPQSYESSSKFVSNIIVVDVNKAFTVPSLNYSENIYASPQTILTIKAPNEEELSKFITKNKQIILDFFTRVEMNRQISFLKQAHNIPASQTIFGLFGYDVWLPVELINSKSGENFYWASNKSSLSNQSFVIYSYPYTDQNTLTKDYFIHKRDSVMRANIPSYKVGSYMYTDTLSTTVRPIAERDNTMEARGLWRMKDDIMSGPYVSHVQLDKENKRVITTEIFLSTPDRKKGNLLRRLESSLYTLKHPKEDAIDGILLNIDKATESN